MRALAVAVPILLMLAGCGDKDSSESGYVTPETSEDGRYVIELAADRAFEPSKAKVPTDALVVFRFGLEGCDVRSEQAGGPDSRTGQYHNGIYGKGEEYTWPAPSSSADFDMYCSKHRSQGMTASLRVG